MDATDSILNALAEIRRRQILAIKLNPQTKDLISDAYAFAVSKSIYPLYDESVSFLEDKDDILRKSPFIETYDISREQVDEVVTLIDQAVEKGESISFSTLEATFYSRLDWNRKWRHLRIDLMHVCRYIFLSGAFADTWEKFLEGAPSEAKALNRKWRPDELKLDV